MLVSTESGDDGNMYEQFETHLIAWINDICVRNGSEYPSHIWSGKQIPWSAMSREWNGGMVGQLSKWICRNEQFETR